MNDVAYRINTSDTVKKGTAIVSIQKNGSYEAYRANEKTFANESPTCTGLVDRFDEITYYTAS